MKDIQPSVNTYFPTGISVNASCMGTYRLDSFGNISEYEFDQCCKGASYDIIPDISLLERLVSISPFYGDKISIQAVIPTTKARDPKTPKHMVKYQSQHL